MLSIGGLKNIGATVSQILAGLAGQAVSALSFTATGTNNAFTVSGVTAGNTALRLPSQTYINFDTTNNNAFLRSPSSGVLEVSATQYTPAVTNTTSLGTASIGWSGIFTSGKITNITAGNSTGTPGNATLNTPTGRSAIAIGAAAVTITNSLVSATSIVLVVLQSADATLTQILRVVPAAGSFVVTGNANATAATNIGWVVFN